MGSTSMAVDLHLTKIQTGLQSGIFEKGQHSVSMASRVQFPSEDVAQNFDQHSVAHVRDQLKASGGA